MNRFDIGTHLWVSRFSPKVFNEVLSVDGEWVCNPTKTDLFQAPCRYIITSAYAENENSKKWILELVACATDSDEHSESVNPLEFSVAAPLSGAVEQNIRIELNLNKVDGGVFKTYDDFIVTKKRIKNFQTLSRQIGKLQKTFKNEKKYKDLGLVSRCLLDIKTESQVARMLENHPENFL